jgi:hypothetical protein
MEAWRQGGLAEQEKNGKKSREERKNSGHGSAFSWKELQASKPV